MTGNQIIEETLRYLNDNLYSYAILIDGEWGCGKTYFVNTKLKDAIDLSEQKCDKPRVVKYISLYGCKDIIDIQENIVWVIADEARKYIERKSKRILRRENKIENNEIKNNILHSTKKIGNEIVRKLLPGKTVYDIAADWLNMKSYIFIVDDLERCECPINEVFGLLNGLVEHEGTKVIIVANEQEIDVKGSYGNVELQYMLSLSDAIEWPIKNEDESTRRPYKEKSKVRLDEAEWRRNIMFPKNTITDYKRISEKLIGVKLRYDPDLNDIINQIISSTKFDEDRKETLLEHKTDYMRFMDFYRHHNLRTFQFFLSKVNFLLMELNKLNVDEEYYKDVTDIFIKETFRCAIEYKSNYMPVDDPYSVIKREENAKSKMIKEYIETGLFKEDSLRDDIDKILADKKSVISVDDPFYMLYYEYYYHTQNWNEEQLNKMIDKLSRDKYPKGLYGKILIITVRLFNLGFDKAFLDETKEYMISNLQKSEINNRLDGDLWFLDEGEQKNQIKRVIDEINYSVDSYIEGFPSYISELMN